VLRTCAVTTRQLDPPVAAGETLMTAEQLDRAKERCADRSPRRSTRESERQERRILELLSEGMTTVRSPT